MSVAAAAATGGAAATCSGGEDAAPKDRGASSGPDADADDGASEQETLTCVICCDEVTAIAIGPCGHSHTCARCCLRLRMCYHDMRCPLCKAANQEVVVTRAPAPGQEPDRFEDLMQRRSSLWQRPKWSRGVLVNDAAAAGGEAQQQQQQQPRGRRSRPLHFSLLAMTSRSCCVCDADGRRPFPTQKLLLDHLRYVRWSLRHLPTCTCGMACGMPNRYCRTRCTRSPRTHARTHQPPSARPGCSAMEFDAGGDWSIDGMEAGTL